MQAPLGRAVIGGLVASTLSTLLVLPAVFSLLLGNRKPVPTSIDPDDPLSNLYDGGDPSVPMEQVSQPKPTPLELKP